MTIDLQDFANELSQSIRISNIPSYVECKPEASPIDEFYASLQVYLSMGGAGALNTDEVMGRLLLIGIVSAAENYFRSIISGIVNICPVAQTCAADRPVALGAITWHSSKRYSRSAFEHASLADAKGLRSAFRDCIGLKLDDSVFSASLAEYEKVCQLRHGIVHNDGFMPGKNALKLELPKMPGAARIIIRYNHLQDVAAAVNALVRLLNRELFVFLCKRWAVDWRQRSDWTSTDEDSSFTKIWDLFLSREDLRYRPGKSKITKKACVTRVRQEYGLI